MFLNWGLESQQDQVSLIMISPDNLSHIMPDFKKHEFPIFNFQYILIGSEMLPYK